MPDNQTANVESSSQAAGGRDKTGGIDSLVTEQDIIIHTMPRRFLFSKPAANKAKNVGLLILIIGGIILVFGSIFLYIYIFKTELPPVENNQQTNEAASSTEKSAEKPDLNRADISDASSSISSSTDSQPISTTSEPQITEPINSVSSSSVEEIDNSTTTKTIKAFSLTTTPASFIYPADADGDGLYDTEETVMGTNKDLLDSDGDSYNDLTELLGLYNPAGAGGIIVNANIEKYINNKYGFWAYYPYIWTTEEIDKQESMIFKLGENQFIQIMVEDNAAKKTLSEWYKEKSGSDYIKNDQIVYKKGWEAIKSENGLAVYLAKSSQNYVIIMSYSLGDGNVINYENIFDMMVNSLEVGGQ